MDHGWGNGLWFKLGSMAFQKVDQITEFLLSIPKGADKMGVTLGLIMLLSKLAGYHHHGYRVDVDYGHLD